MQGRLWLGILRIEEGQHALAVRRDIEAGEELTIDYDIPLWFAAG